jgi:hypothetical protein
MDGRAKAEWGTQRPSGCPARDRVDGRVEAEWVRGGVAQHRMGARAGDGRVSGRTHEGAHGEIRVTQLSNKYLIRVTQLSNKSLNHKMSVTA